MADSTSVGRPGARADKLKQSMLNGPVAATLLRFAAPTVAVVTVQALVGVMETYFVGFLGTEALAGVALVFPIAMLMQMMSAGGMGGGVSSAIARALGAGRKDHANALAVHALLIALALGVVFTGAMLWCGRPLYRFLGGHGSVLEVASAYSNIVFGGSVAMWLFNTLGAILRGAGNMVLPAKVSLFGAFVLVPLSALLIFGFGPIPPFGVPGAAWAFVLYYVGASAVLAVALLSRDGPIALIFARFRPDRRHFRAIFGVGAISALMTVQANLIVVIVTGIVGAFGTAALAGYGLAARLDYLLVPLLFGLGSATVTLIATNIGAGQIERARKIAWTAVAIGAGVTEIIGIVVAVAPHLWLGLFSEAPDVLQTGATYLRVVGPFYGCFGAAMILYFCAQGAGSMGWPFAGGIVRLLLATVGGWVAVSYLDAGLTGLSLMIAVSYAFFAALNAFTLRRRVSEVPKPAHVETGSE